MRPTFLFVIFGVMTIASVARAQVELDSASFSGEIEAGRALVFEVDPDPEDGALEVDPPRETELMEEALAVLDMVPQWLRRDLRAQFRLRPFGEQIQLAEAIMECPDDRLLDEVAFVAAHLAPEASQISNLDLMILNAELIYETADLLDYVEIVEHEEPEPYTTLSYTFLTESGEESWELPRDQYYWLVVHPSLDVESFDRVSPRSGRLERDGWFWRDYYLSDDPDPDRSHRLHVSLRSPDHVTDELLNEADWTTAPAHGTLVDPEIGPIELIRDADGGAPVAVTFVRGDGRCCNSSWPNPDGQFYATLMPLEQVAGETPEPLRDLLDAGTDNMPLHPNTLVDAAWGSYEEEPRAVLIVRDRIPFDLDEDPNETLLAELERSFTVVSSAELAEMTLTTDEDPHVVVDYNKIVIPSDQPRELYEVLEARTEEIERFVDYGGVFQLHGATRPEDDWSDLRLPGGLRCTPQTADGYIEAVAVAGFPDLVESLQGVTYVWDGGVYPGLPGDRLLDPSEGALSVVGWFTTQNMTTNVSEHAFWTRNSSPDRMQQPARLLWQHYGNCGELQDVLGAASRAALLPVWLVSSMADDHVWNEFYAWGAFYPYQVDWSDGPTRIGNWGVAADDDTGGGKTVSGMVGWGGDGWLHNILGRSPEEVDDEGLLTNDYTRHGTVEITVTDAEGHPVDGALVVISTNNFYNESQRSAATWSFTDQSGVASIPVGEENHYWYRVRSEVGHDPAPFDDDDDPFDLADPSNSALAHESEMEPGVIIEREVQLDGELGAAEPEAIDPPELDDEGGVRVSITLTASASILAARSPYTRWSFNHVTEPGAVDLYVVDEDNLDELEDGDEFEAILLVEDASEGTYEVELPAGDEFYVVVSNTHRMATSEMVDVQVSISSISTTGEPDAGPDGGSDDLLGPVNVGGGGCDCAASGRVGASFALRRFLSL